MIRITAVLAAVLLSAAAASAQTEPPAPLKTLKKELRELRADIALDSLELRADTIQVRAERAALRADVKAYREAVAQYGAGSPQAEAALVAVAKGDVALHDELARRHDERVDRRRDASESIELDALVDRRLIALLRAQIKHDVADLIDDGAQIKSDRAGVRAALKDYEVAVETYGRDSVQAQAAEAALDQAQATLHQEIGDWRDARRDLFADLRKLDHDKHDLRLDRKIALLRADIAHDVVVAKDDGKDVVADRTAVKADFQAYRDAVAQYGLGSAQAAAAGATLDQAQIALHVEIGDWKDERADVRRDERELRRDERDERVDRADRPGAEPRR